MNKYIIHWKDGKKETVTGPSIQQAFINAGYGGGALLAVDYWEKIN